jgi:hypothetical protein
MTREEAITKSTAEYSIEDPKVINLCIKRLGLTQEQFEELLEIKPKTFRDYPNNYNLIKKLKPFIWIFSKSNLIPSSTYDKYFNCGK